MEMNLLKLNKNTKLFLIIGAQKAGTSSFYKYLIQHPQVIGTEKKECHFFDDNYIKGIPFYKTFFPDIQNNIVIGEATPNYLFHPQVAKRIRNHFPSAKLIILLRNPIDRAISHYYHNRKYPAREPLSMSHAFKFERLRIKVDYQRMCMDESFNSQKVKYFSYLKRGEYYIQLKRYFDLFPYENIAIYQSEKFFDDPIKILQMAFQFLEIDTYVPKDLKPKNICRFKKEVPSDVFEMLKHYFKPYNEKLYNFLSNSYDW